MAVIGGSWALGARQWILLREEAVDEVEVLVEVVDRSGGSRVAGCGFSKGNGVQKGGIGGCIGSVAETVS